MIIKNLPSYRDSRSKAGKVPDVNRDIPLDVKLRELDALYAPKLAEAGARVKT